MVQPKSSNNNKNSKTKATTKSWELRVVQLTSIVAIAVLGVRCVMTTGEANQVFFPEPSNGSGGGSLWMSSSSQQSSSQQSGTSAVGTESTPTVSPRIQPIPPEAFNRTGSTNYFNLAMAGQFGDLNMEPLQVMELYIHQHSKQTLQREYDTCPSCLEHRKFLVAWYSCPKHAGRRLHSVLNSLAWAITTNRTLLVAYLDETQCQTNEAMWNTISVRCNETNTQSDCNQYMTLQDWVPSYTDWIDQWRTLQNQTTTSTTTTTSNAWNTTPNGMTMPEVIRADSISSRDVWARPMDQPDAPTYIHIGVQQMNLVTGIDLARPIQRYKLLSQPHNRDKAMQLFFYGYYFAYGMMLEALFTLVGSMVIHPPPAAAAAADVATTTNTTTTTTTERDRNHPRISSIALHSRHPRPGYERGYNILESICIRQLLEIHNDTCVVYIMSDSTERYAKLEQQIADIGCIAQRQTHALANDDAFYKDWILLRDSVRHGFVAPHRKLRQGIGMRPSSSLLREAVEFRRVLEGNARSLPQECFSRHDWTEGAYANCTPVEKLLASFGLERHQQLHGIIKDPCVWRK